LYQFVWAPVERVIPASTRHVIVSPDAALSQVPFGALLAADGSFLIERRQISYVTAGRNLLAGDGGAPEKRLTLFAAPPLVLPGQDGKGQEGVASDLPGTRLEASAVRKKAEPAGWRVTVYSDEQASEARLHGERSPGILHLATHGGMLSGGEGGELMKRLAANPMYRGYVELAGSRGTWYSWTRGDLPRVENDGILTAEEASGLDLGRTWVTVLAACETGLGEARPGEGILGLERAFLLAGSKHLLVSLWQIDDRATAEFMEHFYRELLGGADPRSAFHAAQLRELRRLRESQSAACAITKAGAFKFLSRGQ
jgi:CHAT domain-containing protein